LFSSSELARERLARVTVVSEPLSALVVLAVGTSANATDTPGYYALCLSADPNTTPLADGGGLASGSIWTFGVQPIVPLATITVQATMVKQSQVIATMTANTTVQGHIP